MAKPKVFISYAWGDDELKIWVKEFATQLRSHSVETILDQWELAPGDQLPVFMERSVRESDFVLVICTPTYREKSDKRMGGVGYEGDIMSAEIATGADRRKFIPLLRDGDWKHASPSWLRGSYYIDLRGNPYSGDNFIDLLKSLHKRREEAPDVKDLDDSIFSRKPPDIPESAPDSDIPSPADAYLKIRAIQSKKKSNYPTAVDPKQVGWYPAFTKSGAGYFYDDVLEYRVWIHPHAGGEDLYGSDDDYFCAFISYEEALAFSKETAGAEEPLVLIRQDEHINEPEPGKFEHKVGERITEWRVEWLQDSKRQPNSIADFLRKHQK